MTKNALLMSIRPQYANKIFDGSKTVELRRIKPKFLGNGDLVFIYVSSPVKSLLGAFVVSSVVEKPLASLWNAVRNRAGISKAEFLNYYVGEQSGVAIFIKDVWLLPKPIHLTDLKRQVKGFHPPQSYHYTSIQYINNID